MLPAEEKRLSVFLAGKSEITLLLFDHFVAMFNSVGKISVEPTKTMISISSSHKSVAWVTQLGKNFIHVVFPFKQEYPDNLCFQKIAWVPGQQQFNHHFRMYSPEDINEEVMGFMKIAYLEL